MPQNATKARKILYGPGGTDWTGPMQRGTVTRDTCVDQRMRVFRGMCVCVCVCACLNAVMSLVINMYVCVHIGVGCGGKDISTSNYNPLS